LDPTQFPKARFLKTGKKTGGIQTGLKTPVGRYIFPSVLKHNIFNYSKYVLNYKKL
jgi:hypothetical protein